MKLYYLKSATASIEPSETDLDSNNKEDSGQYKNEQIINLSHKMFLDTFFLDSKVLELYDCPSFCLNFTVTTQELNVLVFGRI